ncbi:MAG: S8 family serine peptidase [Saprospirales bacterium]|nr:S8 family serine peptidase [Saprospirales bacterium]
MNKPHPAIYLIFLVFCLGTSSLSAQPAPIPGQVLIELQPHVHPDDFLRIWNLGRSPSETLSWKKNLSPSFNIHLFKIGMPENTPLSLPENLQDLEAVLAAQWDYELRFNAVPDDPDYPSQWSLPHVGAEQAWDQTTGGLSAQGDTLVVAILDAGFDVYHYDLAPNIWRNRQEIPNDGLDNDANGYTDDTLGWNFADDSTEHPADLHGTSVAGIIGAAGNNNKGISGMNWNIKMMLLTTQTVSQVVEAYSYILDQRWRYQESNGEMGALVVATNASFGVAGMFCSQQPIWGAMYDRLGQAGILTAAAASNEPVNIDETGDMPASCPSPFLVTVLETGYQDQKDPSSAFGPLSIDMGAPGTGILTTQPNNKYGNFHGTSASAPHVCGAIALLFSNPCPQFAEDIIRSPQQSALVVRSALLQGVAPVESLDGLTLTGGRLDVAESMQVLEQQCWEEAPDVLKILRIFPNPAIEGVEVEFQCNPEEEIHYRVIDMIGQTVLENQLPASPWPVRHLYIPLGAFSGGYYLIALRDGSHHVSKAFFLQ